MTVASTEWIVGIALGVVVIAVAAAILITIVVLAARISKQAATAEEAVEVVRAQTDELRRRRAHQRLRRAHPALRARAAEGGGRQVSVAAAYFEISLIIGVVAAGVVVVLIVLLLGNLAKIQRSVDGLLEIAGKVGANTANIPQLEATAPVLALIVEEAIVQDGYMNALTDGFDGK